MSNQSPIPGLKVAGPDDLKALLPMQVVMGYDWTSYWNRLVLDSVNQGSKRRLTHLKFVPDVVKGLLYAIPAMKGDYGAIKLDYTGTENGAEFSLYIPLLSFELARAEGRQRIIPVELKEPVKGVVHWALNIEESTSVPVKKGGSQAAPKGTPAEGIRSCRKMTGRGPLGTGCSRTRPKHFGERLRDSDGIATG